MPEKETPNFKFPSPTSVGEVKLGATNIEELANSLDTFLAGKILIFKSYAAGATLKSGEFAEQTKAGETFTLPVATTANRVIGVYGAAACKVTTSGGAFIIGDFITAASKTATISLAEGQHVVLQSNGTNWIIVAGEPKRQTGYVRTKPLLAEAEAGITPSVTRPASVTVFVDFFGGEVGALVFVGGEEMGTLFKGPTGTVAMPVTLWVGAGETWQIKKPPEQVGTLSILSVATRLL